MPQNAIQTGAVDAVLSLEEIAEKLVQITKEHSTAPSTTDDELRSLFAILRDQAGQDFSSYKRNTVLRRIERRMVVNFIEHFSDYLVFLANNASEVHALCQELLIGVTNFFRDPEAFEILRSTILPSLFANHDPSEPVRIWHACCSTGEEAYSSAMLVLEYLERENLQTKVQIFATDLDEAAITHARAGVYANEIVADLGEERLQRFFTPHEDHWQVSKQLREVIVFAHHNIIKDPPFSRLDLLVCRNFLIYLNPDIQTLLIPLFHQVLNPRGVLFLGPAETIGQHGDLFTPIDKKWKFFARQSGKRRAEALFPYSGTVRQLREIQIQPFPKPADTDKAATVALADKLLMERYVPARIIINERNEVVHFSSRAGAYLVTPEGEPTRDLLKIAREELRPALRAATYKAFTTQSEIAYRGIRVETEGGPTTLNIIVVPLLDPQLSIRQAMVIIEPALPSSAPRAPAEEAAVGDASLRTTLTSQLEEQLRVTSEQLQSTSEQLETSNERFMLANEELMTVNEELQSSNEELQSTNEELVTVNSELQRKMEELNQSNSDMHNLLASSEVAIFFLCPKLSIKRYSPAMAALFNVTPADIGRSIRQLDGIIDWSHFSLDAAMILEQHLPVVREIESIKDDRSFFMRTIPYKTSEGVIDGFVVTLVDISGRKRAETALHASEKALLEGHERLQFALESCRIGAWDLNLEDQTVYRSPEHSRIFGYSEMLPQWTFAMFIDHVVPEDRAKVEEIIQRGLQSQQGWSFECRIRRADDQIRWIWVSGRLNTDASGNRRSTGVVQDITARKETEDEMRQLLAAVQQEKDKLASLIDSMVDEVWFADTGQHFTLANPTAFKNFDIESSDAIDIEQFAASLEVFRPDGSPRPIEEAPPLRALQGETIHNEEEIIRLPATGALRHREVSANAVRDADGGIIGAVAVVRDITERKQAEESVRLYEFLSKNSRDIILFVRREDGQILEANAAAVAAYGYTREELLGVKIKGLRATDTFQLTEAQMAEADAKGILFESTHRRKNGTTFPVEVSAQGTDYKGARILLSVVRDVTARKKAEEKLRFSEQRRTIALEAVRAGTWEWDLQTNENVWSQELWALYGLEPFCCEPSYAAWLQTVHPNDQSTTERIIKEAVARGESFSAEWRVVLRDGSQRWLMSRGKPLTDSNGAVVRYLGIVIDNTEHKGLDEERRVLQAQLAQAQKMEAIGTLAGGIAHDFNNILGAIIGFAEMARESSPSGSDIARDLDRVLEAGGRAANLVKQILAFSREASAVHVPLDPVPIVKETIKLLRPALPSTIDIKLQLDAGTRSILADPTQIHQIVMNLCTNAYHAMEQTGGVLEITLKDCELTKQDIPLQSDVHPGSFVELAIRDTGPGIPQEIKDKIFEPYFTTKETGKGTGMGLSIIHGIVISMGGFITCENKPEHGALFRIFIPTLEEEIISSPEAQEIIVPGKERLLFIDDEAILAEMGQLMLERLGYTVTIRTSSIDALTTFQNQPDQFDAVITDQTMPGMTGFDLARRMLQIRSDIPIILCTGYSNLVNEEQAKNIGIKGFIMKPMSMKDIGKLLRTVLGEE